MLFMFQLPNSWSSREVKTTTGSHSLARYSCSYGLANGTNVHMGSWEIERVIPDTDSLTSPPIPCSRTNNFGERDPDLAPLLAVYHYKFPMRGTILRKCFNATSTFSCPAYNYILHLPSRISAPYNYILHHLPTYAGEWRREKMIEGTLIN